MAAQKPLQLVNGRIKEVSAVDSSVGAGDTGKVVALDATGRIDNSMMPVGIGPEVIVAPASENLADGDFVNIWNDSGTTKVRKAIADVAGKEADGYVMATVTMGNNATVYFEGVNTHLTSLTSGSRYFLSAATAGTVTTTPPTSTGNIVQEIGKAVSTTTLKYEPTQGVVVA